MKILVDTHEVHLISHFNTFGGKLKVYVYSQETDDISP